MPQYNPNYAYQPKYGTRYMGTMARTAQAANGNSGSAMDPMQGNTQQVMGGGNPYQSGMTTAGNMGGVSGNYHGQSPADIQQGYTPAGVSTDPYKLNAYYMPDPTKGTSGGAGEDPYLPDAEGDKGSIAGDEIEVPEILTAPPSPSGDGSSGGSGSRESTYDLMRFLYDNPAANYLAMAILPGGGAYLNPDQVAGYIWNEANETSKPQTLGEYLNHTDGQTVLGDQGTGSGSLVTGTASTDDYSATTGENFDVSQFTNDADVIKAYTDLGLEGKAEYDAEIANATKNLNQTVVDISRSPSGGIIYETENGTFYNQDGRQVNEDGSSLYTYSSGSGSSSGSYANNTSSLSAGRGSGPGSNPSSSISGGSGRTDGGYGW